VDVHVVVDSPDKDYILPRLANQLRKRNGWTVSDQARSDADVNYCLPYYLLPRAKEAGTLTAAWFTHKDTTDSKLRSWDLASRLADLRITTCPHWTGELALKGRVGIVHLGIDLQLFTPSGRTVEKAIVGTSGIVYGGGRKGEWLFEALQETDPDLTLRAIGQGWDRNVSAGWLQREDVPDFYRSLNVYVCTSLIDAGPSGPLEALACSTKVVVPYHVGLMDQLPDIRGIHRYIPGNLGSMRMAIREALNADPVPGILRASVLKYSYDNWAESNMAVMNGLGDIHGYVE
jgi:glycosyltransferase involved in cell wall biosynthesis